MGHNQAIETGLGCLKPKKGLRERVGTHEKYHAARFEGFVFT
jgi:hypothetical protein